MGTAFAWLSQGNGTRRWLIVAVVFIWAARLAIYIWRRVRSLPEDGRYQTMKAEWGVDASRRMFRFYQLQAIAVVLFAIPILIAAHNDQPLSWLDFVGVSIGWFMALLAAPELFLRVVALVGVRVSCN
jgi:steroid 5-alpha reductase family enzyme